MDLLGSDLGFSCRRGLTGKRERSLPTFDVRFEVLFNINFTFLLILTHNF